MIERISVAANGFTFDAAAAGPSDGEPVLLLHGFPQTSWSYRHQLPALADAGFRAVAPDQRGYSPRARPTETSAYEGEHLVGDVLAIADELGFDRFHLVGHDWGGAIAWQVGGRHQERLLTLTVLSTPHPRAFGQAMRGETGGDQAQRSGYVQIFRQENSEDMFVADDAAGLRGLYQATGISDIEAEPYVNALGTKDAMRAALNWYRASDLTFVTGLGEITMPTMYVWSTEDVALGREAAEATADCVSGPYRFEVLDGISHWIAEHAPERLNALLLDHLRGYDSYVPRQ